jgi:hypothetical protein
MMPRLEAEESLRRAKEISLGTGALKNPRAVADHWERQAAADDTPPPVRKPKMFSDEVLGRLPVRRVVKQKG